LWHCWGASDIIQDGHHLGFYQKLEIIKKQRKLKIFDAGHVECDTIRHFAAFCQHFVLFSPEKGDLVMQKWL